MEETFKKIVADTIPDPTGGLLSTQDKLDSAIEVIDPFVQVTLGEKSLKDGANDLFDAGLRVGDRVMENGLGAAEKGANTVIDGVESTIEGAKSLCRTLGSFLPW